MRPPLLPSETLRRVLRVARFDGISVLLFAGAGALLSADFRDVTGSVVGLLVAGAGAIELHGVSLLRRGDERGMRWLVSSQAFLMVSMLGFVAYELLNPNLEFLRKVLTGEVIEQIQQAGMTVDQFLTFVFHLIYYSVAAATLVYQGVMILYYVSKRAAVVAALEEPTL